ncbi:tape measure protein [Streptococcus sciuri]|uniref:Tape measure protein n=1 Tax=Streptococcus sciuri TaxID=2973939 RepID=A0ABT2F7H4_9STRE|nr:tape measure protein [Streptococcus sciuri]MCS4488374.1 tape measure protein [Streptococcus sciuri]
MAKKIQAQMSTEIALDVVKASQSVRQLTNVVNSATNAWKAQEAQLKAVGDYTKAAETKYQGLGNAIEAQKAKIDNLKQKQAELKGSTTETAGEYLKYQQQIDQATTRLASMEAQQTKAKQSMDYYKSGLADLQKSYKAQNDLVDSKIKRLEAEGKEEEAQKARVSGLKEAILNLSRQYETQEKMLTKIARESGEASEAYHKQKIKLNETATAMAKAKGEQDKLNAELKKLGEHPTLVQKLKEKMKGLGEETESVGKKAHQTGSIFTSVFSANVVSSAFVGGLGRAKSLFSELLQQGNDYIRYQEVMTASWTTLTGSAKEGRAMVDMTNDMAQAASNSAQMVDELNKKIYSVTHSADDTKQLTNTILTLQDAFGVADDAVQNFATQWGQMLGNGKVQAQDMLSFMNVFPTIKQEMIGVISEMKGGAEITNATFAEMQKNGEVTAEIANKALQRMGEKYKDATKNFANTTEGLERTIKGRGPALIAAVEEPFSKMKNPLLAKASEWIASDETKKRFTTLGEVASRGLDKVIDSFKKVFKMKDSGEVMNHIMDKLTGFVEKMADSIAKNAPAIAQFAKNALSGVGSVASIATSLGEGVWAVAKDTIDLIASAFGAMSGNSKKSKSSVTGLAGGLKEIAKHKEAIKAVGIVIGGYFIASHVIKGFQSLYKGITLVKTGFQALKLAFATNPFGLIVLGVTAAGVALYELYKHSKAFRKFVDGLIKWAKNLYKGFVSFFGKAGKFIGDTFNGIKKNVGKAYKATSDTISQVSSGISKGWKSTWQGASDYLTNSWSVMQKRSKIGSEVLRKLLSLALDSIGQKFSDTWDGIKKGFSAMWQGLKDLAGSGINAVIKIPNAGIDGINGLIESFGGSKNAIKKIPKVKFAQGTGALEGISRIRKAITSPTLALLNDGNDSPETGNRETVIFPNGHIWQPQGRNVSALLPAGTEVLNAFETRLLSSLGNQVPFKSGTGFWSKIWNTTTQVAGNVWDGIKDTVSKFAKMLGYISDAVKDPIGTLARKFNPKADKLDGLFNPLGTALFKTPINTAKSWWKELWSMAQSAADEGSSVAMGAVGDDYPAKWKNMAKDAMADPWGYFIRECVSFVASRLNNWGVNPAKFSHLGNGSDWVNARVPHMSKPKAGSVAVYAPGSQFPNHVAIVSSVNGDRYSGEEYNYGGDGRYHTFSNRLASGATTFLDFGVKGGSSTDGGSDSAKKANNPLQQLIKRQVGGMFDWIKKFLAPETDSEPSGGGGTGVARWRDSVVKALKANGFEATQSQVNAWMKVIQRESNGNPRAVNNWDSNARAGIPSKGLVQTIEPTFNAYKHPGHNNIFNGYDNLLAGIAYAAARYGRGPSMFARVSGPLGYANGGLVSQHGVYELAENNKPEYVIPTDIARRSRAWQLLAEVVGHFIGEEGDKKRRDSETGALSALEHKLDTMIGLLGQLVANGQQPLEIRNIIDGQGVSNGLAPYMATAQEAYDKRMAILRGERGGIV